MAARDWLGLGPQTAPEKNASLQGISLFFGALIGANLGTAERMPLRDYALLVAVVCLVVLYIHLAPVARRRWSHVAALLAGTAGLYGLLVHEAGAALFTGPRPSPHLFATICFWLASLAVVELRPVLRARREAEAGVEAVAS